MPEFLTSIDLSGIVAPAIGFLSAVVVTVLAYLKGRRDNDRKRDEQDRTTRLRAERRIDDALREDDDDRSDGEHWTDRLRRAGH